MKFKEAFEEMKSGIPVKLPSWAGYWWWDEESPDNPYVHKRRWLSGYKRNTECGVYASEYSFR